MHPGLGTFCLGFSGGVTRVRDNGPDARVVTGLPSIFNGGEALGPSDIRFTGNRKFVLSIGLGGSDEFLEGFGDGGELLATLVSGKLNRNGVKLFADVMDNELATNPEPTDIDSNPTGILRKGNGYFITDSGGNALLHVNKKGSFKTIAVLPPTAIGADPVPTSVVRGPDGALYVSQLTGFPFQPGAANILARSCRARLRRCSPRGSPTSPTSPSPATDCSTPSRSRPRGCSAVRSARW